ncbi:unnamed protein product [Rhizoctonia solani]|uniref:AB hydrolase-1 domain-containing protein n=1 Tax=Rhizoctonia solani TaxID=456999 RepID=A0A8H3H943_9AGAM|nr:unnamed protein product [Rhizoctonia solani]
MDYPRPIGTTHREAIKVRTLTPLANNQGVVSPPLPQLPDSTTNRAFITGWTCSTHVFQAATPRDSAPPALANRSSIPTGEVSKDERKVLADTQLDELKKFREAIASGKMSYANDATMWTVANRYAPEKPCKGANTPAVTVVLTHGTGFHKEIWETTLRYLLSTPQGQASVDEIWALDAANHGDSALLNKDNLGAIYEWSDHARDILNFLVNFLPDRNEPGQIEHSLSRVPEQNAQRRRQHGFTHRTIVGIGHSFGGARAALDSPRLFSSIVLVDPIIYPSYAIRYSSSDPLALGALMRREHWPDRETAKSSFLKSPFFRAWHPDVLADHVQYGIVEEGEGVRLKCSGFQEAVTFAESARLHSEVWELLPTLDERIPMKWIMDSTHAWSTGGSKMTQHTVWRRPVNTTNVKIKGTGHLAATPRESPPPGLIAKPAAPAKMSKAERQAFIEARFNEIKELREAIYFGSRTFPVNDAIMWTVANRYAPEKPRVGASPAVTVVLSHGTGFHKEIWETTLKYLLSTPQGQGSIDEIWALDAVNHGDSGLLNKDSLGEIFEWSDHARDILNFLANFMPDKLESHVESNLPRIPEQATNARLKGGFANRTIVGIGHSFGGCTLARAAIDSPRLFSSIILLDPVIYASYAVRGPGIDALTKGALARRDHWPDRESTKSQFLKSPFFQKWHPDVLADHVKYGTVQDDQGVRLKCSGYQEAVTFGENARLPCEVWELLPTLDERIPIRWIMDSTKTPVTGGPELTQHTVWRRPANSSNTQIKGAGHLIPQEAPEALAHEILNFIQTHHGAASPRESPPSGPIITSATPAEMSKAERQALAEARFSEITQLRRDIAFGIKTFPLSDAAIWTVANRYAPEKPRVGASSPGVTVVLFHATGFHKEIWETTLKCLLSTPQGQGRIDEIWALDAASHGDSGLLNKDGLGDIFQVEWSDHTRDILNFLANFLPDRLETQVELNLSRIPEQITQQRLKHGFTNRTVVGIGHSFGGCTVARAAIECPNLFSSLILVDPVIFSSYADRGLVIDALIKGASSRRDHWPDRESAKSGFLKSPFFRSWHPDVLADYIQYGTAQDDQGTRLKCSGYQEAVAFGENARLPCEVWELLPTLDERIPIRWIMNSTRSQGSITGGPELTQHTVWRRPANSTNTQIKGTGHLIPLEAPEALAREILDFIQKHHMAKSKL